MLDYPTQFSIETTTLCMGGCRFCCNTYANRPTRHMDFDLYRRVMDEIETIQAVHRKGIDRVYLNCANEPLAYNRFHDAMSYAYWNGLPGELSTNCYLLFGKQMDTLLTFPPDAINLSMDTDVPEDISKIRPGLDGRCLENAKHYLAIRKERQDFSCRIQIIVMANEVTEPYYEDMLRRWLDRIDGMPNTYLHPRQMVHYPSIPTDAPMVRMSFLQRFEGKDIRNHPQVNWHDEAVSPLPCSMLEHQACILVDGSVGPCCHADKDYYGIGRVGNGETILSLWQSPKWREIQQAGIDGRWHDVPHCSTCS